MDQLRDKVKDRISLFTGNSGVGKSTLINAIDPTINARTGAVSKFHGKGMHTTTFSEVFLLDQGGYIIDTPGIKGFGLIDINNEELNHYFPDMMYFAPECEFYNCTHIHEPGCAVRQAIERGDINYNRYESYIRMLEQDGKYR